jgi:NADH-quinone oxidoreductase subunit A
MGTGMEYFFVLLFVGLSGVFVAGGLIFSRLLAPNRPTFLKNSTYECGEKPIGSGSLQFNVGYYLFALLFLVFEVEAAFLYPWAVILKEVGLTGLIEVGIFLLILILGLVYAWRKAVLEWV